MTSTQNDRPGRRSDRMDVAIRRWEANNPGSYFAGVTYDDRTGDAFIDHVPGGNVPGGNVHRYTIAALRQYGLIVTYRVDAADIDAALTPRTDPVVERLRAHGLPTVPAVDGGAILSLTAAQAEALADALDRLEGR